MDSEDAPFLECIDAFARHDYERAGAMALELTSKRLFLWIIQVLLISLERCGHNDNLQKVFDISLNSFSESPFAIGMIKLTVGRAAGQDFRDFADLNERQLLQLNFYEASRYLTLGDRSTAAPGFRACLTASVKYPERDWAESELNRPEPADLILRRLALQAQQPTGGFASYDILTCTRSALQIVKNEAISDKSMVLPVLDVLARRLLESTVSAEWMELNRQLAELHHAWRRDILQRPATAKTGLLQRIRGAARGVRGGDATPADAVRPPFTRFSGRLRQLRSSTLGPLEKLALEFGFPLFLGRHPLLISPEREIHTSMRALAKEGDNSREVSPYCRRRFSGDTSREFPRSRYYHAIPDDLDDPTLFCEMNAYSMPALVGYSCARPGHQRDVIELVFRGLPDEPNPLFLGLAHPESFDHVFTGLPGASNPLAMAASDATIKAQVPSTGEFVISIGLTTSHDEFENCLDLRLPEARCWLIKLFNDPPAGLFGHMLKVVGKAHQVELGAIRDWADLIPVIYAQTMGGNALTDMIGAHLRTCGCDALIYPSARTDTMVHWADGHLKGFRGWNLVDYRNGGIPEEFGIDIGDPIQNLPGQQEFHQAREGPESGSFTLKGNGLLNRIVNQMHYERYIMAHGPEWRLKHASELHAQGFFWYSKLYGRGSDGFSGTCIACGAAFEDPAAQILERCPRCNYAGDC